VLVVKDQNFDVHLYPAHWSNTPRPQDMLDTANNETIPATFDRETT